MKTENRWMELISKKLIYKINLKNPVSHFPPKITTGAEWDYTIQNALSGIMSSQTIQDCINHDRMTLSTSLTTYYHLYLRINPKIMIPLMHFSFEGNILVFYWGRHLIIPINRSTYKAKSWRETIKVYRAQILHQISFGRPIEKLWHKK